MTRRRRFIAGTVALCCCAISSISLVIPLPRRMLRGKAAKKSDCPQELVLCQPKKKKKPQEPVCPLSLPLCRERQQRQQDQAAAAAAAMVEKRRAKREAKQLALANKAAQVPAEALAPALGTIGAISGPSSAAATRQEEMKSLTAKARDEALSLSTADAQKAVLRAFLKERKRESGGKRYTLGGRRSEVESHREGANGEGSYSGIDVHSSSLSYGERKARAIVRSLALQREQSTQMSPFKTRRLLYSSGQLQQQRRHLNAMGVRAAAAAAECPLALKVCRKAKAKWASTVSAQEAEARQAATAERLRKEATGELKQEAIDREERKRLRIEAKLAIKV